jgi:hypothetical protein
MNKMDCCDFNENFPVGKRFGDLDAAAAIELALSGRSTRQSSRFDRLKNLPLFEQQASRSLASNVNLP